jgi:hypothetical protein
VAMGFSAGACVAAGTVATSTRLARKATGRMDGIV